MRQALALSDDPEFDRFWNAYPRRTAKKEARKAFAAIRPDAALVDKMIAALEWQQHTPQWTKDGGSFIPHPASWLRAERWDDEPFQAIVPELPERSRRNIAAGRTAIALIQGRQ